MLFLRKLFFRKDIFRHTETAATAIEYSLIAGGIALAIALVVFGVGDEIVVLIQDLATALSGP